MNRNNNVQGFQMYRTIEPTQCHRISIQSKSSLHQTKNRIWTATPANRSSHSTHVGMQHNNLKALPTTLFDRLILYVQKDVASEIRDAFLLLRTSVNRSAKRAALAVYQDAIGRPQQLIDGKLRLGARAARYMS